MRKLTKLEASIINDALEVWRETFISQVDAVEKEGKQPLFSKQYPVMMEGVIKSKLQGLTLKK